MRIDESGSGASAILPAVRRIGALALLALLAAFAAVVLPAQAAHAVGTVVVTPEPSADGETRVTLTGSGFQYVPNAPGGIYVFFGVVSDPASSAWAPSQGGSSGATYSYANTDGSILLVAFEGGSSSSEASAVIDANGDWSAELTIPGSSFALSAGNPHDGEAQEGETVDCLQQVCGIITIGAHGNINANNESFTPVTFAPAEPEPAPVAEEPAEEPVVEDEPEVPAVEDEPAGIGTAGAVAIAAGAVVVVGAVVWALIAARRSRAAKRLASEEDSPHTDAVDE